MDLVCPGWLVDRGGSGCAMEAGQMNKDTAAERAARKICALLAPSAPWIASQIFAIQFIIEDELDCDQHKETWRMLSCLR